jgi:hypothetical protein
MHAFTSSYSLKDATAILKGEEDWFFIISLFD